MRLSLRNVNLIKNENVVLKDLNLSITENEFLSVISDDDKIYSYFKEALLGLNGPRTGVITLNERDITSMKPMDKRIAYISTDPYLDENMSIYDNIAYPLRKTKMKEDILEEIVDKLIKALKLEVIKGLVPSSISRYQMLKVSIARAIAFNPEALVFDDILNVLDENKHSEFIEYLSLISDYLNKPIMIYLGRIIEKTKKVLTISIDGIVQDEILLKEVKNYSRSDYTRKLLDLNLENVRYQKELIINVELNDNVLSYNNKRIVLDKALIGRIFDKKSVKYIKLDLDKVSYIDKGNSLKFLIEDANLDNDNIAVIKTDSFEIVRMYRNDYKNDSFLYYPIDEVLYLNDQKEPISTLLDRINPMIPCKVLNQRMGLVEVSGIHLSLNRTINKKVRNLIINDKAVFSLSDDKRKGIKIRRIRIVESLKDFDFISLNLNGISESLNLKIAKSDLIYTISSLYLEINENSFIVPLLEIENN